MRKKATRKKSKRKTQTKRDDNVTAEDKYQWVQDWLNAPKAPKPPAWCSRYQHRQAWRSIYGPHLICAVCHPPVNPNVVAETIEL